MTIFRNLLTGEIFAAHQTRNHPASSYGKPVWVRDDNGEAFDQFGMEPLESTTAPEAAKLRGVNRQRVCELARQGKIPGAEKVGGVWMIPIAWAKREI
ncbi:MAG: helix-turn-helix domain-containing protein [Dehalococcoidales bacterium]|nr:helix-turn-helix domain-containing protein [Dehalococcoidales bacterium]